jgi:hypothetical protein
VKGSEDIVFTAFYGDERTWACGNDLMAILAVRLQFFYFFFKFGLW